MANEGGSQLSNTSHRTAVRASIDAAAKNGIPTLSGVLAEHLYPGSGPAVTCFTGAMVAASGSFVDHKRNKAVEGLFVRLEELCEQINDVAGRSATIEFVLSEEYLVEVRRTLSAIEILSDDEKIELAVCRGNS